MNQRKQESSSQLPSNWRERASAVKRAQERTTKTKQQQKATKKKEPEGKTLRAPALSLGSGTQIGGWLENEGVESLRLAKRLIASKSERERKRGVGWLVGLRAGKKDREFEWTQEWRREKMVRLERRRARAREKVSAASLCR